MDAFAPIHDLPEFLYECRVSALTLYGCGFRVGGFYSVFTRVSAGLFLSARTHVTGTINSRQTVEFSRFGSVRCVWL